MADVKDVRVPRGFGREFTGLQVQVRFDGEPRVIYVSMSRFTDSSPFLKGLIEDPFTSEITLSGISSKLFAIYVVYTQTGKIPCDVDPRLGSTYDDWGNHKLDQYDLMIDLYLLGCKLDDFVFQNTVINAIISTYNEVNETGEFWFLSTELFNKVYDNTQKGSQLRRVVVDIVKWAGTWVFNADASEYNQDLFSELALSLLEDQERSRAGIYSPPETARCCDYHVHGDAASTCDLQD